MARSRDVVDMRTTRDANQVIQSDTRVVFCVSCVCYCSSTVHDLVSLIHNHHIKCTSIKAQEYVVDSRPRTQ